MVLSLIKNKIYKSFLEKECPDLPHYRLHDLRHTYFTLCTEIGFSELSIIATGGHSTIQSTKRYQHATMNRMKSDMAKLEEIFGNTIAARDVAAVLTEGISFGIPSFTLLTKISWEFYCKQERLFV